MKIKVQHCWHGGDKFSFRAVICGGILVYAYRWNRQVASEMLDEICRCVPHLKRENIRFIHV